ncbi:twin-arginine translocation signal domain-containing protein [Hahella sp. KA22]|uniref:sulfite oxidase n=1 Tax=Hahella sp. KA22 TaxID=1628392 RepID=UPI000FDE0667|nr:sulfite oxidase [Hahella sp. KA22]AZZ89734.1 twin-arginine translocation signal domain-containing protein [Hahella sp. KA22]QAY53104.1 twin-arginine translocation signal domain-containing protein [Hahella sp. KA22]
MTDDKKERGLYELYADDPERADYLVFGRRAHSDRRGFLKGAGLGAMGAMLGMAIPFHRNFPSGLIPAAMAEDTEIGLFGGKDGLTLLNDRPINAETPAHLLDDAVTPTSRHFVRNNGVVPEIAHRMDASDWKLTIDGEVEKVLELSLDELKSKFKPVTLKLQLECGGNGRAAFNPPAKGNQWTVGAIGNAEWTGVRYADLLKAAGVKPSAIYTAHHSLDGHLSGDPSKTPISRGVPISKAMDPHSIIAYAMNGEPLPALHGFPVRTICPGWPGSTSQKWLSRIQLRDVVHDGPKMTGSSYRVPKFPVAPGTHVADEDYQIIESMPVKSLITTPQTNQTIKTRTLKVHGHAWAGDNVVKRMDISYDFGVTWVQADLKAPPNPYSWQEWYAEVTFPTRGYYEIWARATDDKGNMQPFAVNWNPKGYLNNSMHRIAVIVDA